MHRLISRLAAAALVCLPAVAPAQDIGAGRALPFSTLLLATGVTAMQVDAINARLGPVGYAGLSNDAVTYGASGYVAVGRALLGADVALATFGEEGLENGRTDDLNTRHALATVGYALLATDRVNAFPVVGVGAGRVDVTLRNRGGTASTSPQPSFDEVARSPGPETTLRGRYLLFSLGAGIDYLVTRGAPTGAGVVLGARAGVVVAPNRTTWMHDGQPAIAGPDGGPGGPFLRVVVGVGRR